MDSAQKNTIGLDWLDWTRFVFEIGRQLQKFLRMMSHNEIYEMLEYESVLELLDPKGATATFEKRQRVKFLQKEVIAFHDHVWGNGEVLGNYQCSPGVAVDHYKDGDRSIVVVSLREAKGIGDIEEFHVRRSLRHTFTGKKEWWQTEMYHNTKRLKFSIIFPKMRHCRRAVLVERNTNRTELLGEEHFAELPDGREILTWEKEKPKRFETYTIKWRW